jgi:hypothetical protein
MKVTQLAVFLKNERGHLYSLCEILGENKINIRALTLAESPEFGIARLVVDKPEEAEKLLKLKGFMANRTEIVPVEVPDKPGGLASVLKVLYENDINVEYMYGFAEKSASNALMVFRFENPDLAITVLQKNKVRVVSNKEITGL